MSGKQKGFTLIEILVVVTIIGVLASLVIVLIPKTQRQAQITESTSNVKGIVQSLEAEGVSRYGGDKEYSGVRLILWLTKKDIKGEALKTLFSPADPDETLERAGGPDAYKTLNLDGTDDLSMYSSYAGRNLKGTGCGVVKGSPEPKVLVCDDSDNHYGNMGLGFVVGYTGGSVIFKDKSEKYSISYDEQVTIGESSKVDELKCMKAD